MFVQALIQSNSHDSRDLLARVELFLETFLASLDEPDAKQRFEMVKESLLARWAHPYDSLMGKLRFLNRLAWEEDGDFLYLHHRIQALRDLQLEDVRSFADKALSRANKNRLAVISNGNSPENAEFAYAPWCGTAMERTYSGGA
jgi:insulysin